MPQLFNTRACIVYKRGSINLELKYNPEEVRGARKKLHLKRTINTDYRYFLLRSLPFDGLLDQFRRPY